ncbi:MAG: iron ABC transporter permease [SAR324 cluster bacterium]|nr:iron ABC transporter permease [SAR324 cluster bacterium]
MTLRRWAVWGLGGLALSAFVVGFYGPILHFLVGPNPLKPETPALSWPVLHEVLSDSWILGILGFSLFQAFLSAVLSILVALPGAWVLSRYDFPARRWFEHLTFLPFLLPTILVVLAMVLFFGNRGWLNQALGWLGFPQVQFLYSLSGILIAHVFFNVPLALKLISAAWMRLSGQYEDAAQMLGAAPWRRFRTLLVPLLLPSILSAFAAIFLLCLNSFAVLLVLGGGPKHTTLEVLIYQLARIELDLPRAAALALLQSGLAIVLLALLLQLRPPAPKQRPPVLRRLGTDRQGKRPGAWFALAVLLALTTFALGPLLAVLVDSVRVFRHGQWHFSLQAYLDLFGLRGNTRFLDSMQNSFGIALGGATLAALLGCGTLLLILNSSKHVRPVLEGAFLLPVALSTVVFGITWFHLYQRLPEGQVALIWVIVAMHGLLVCPYWLRIMLPAAESVPRQWLQVSRMLGHSTGTFLRVVLLPWLRPSLATAFFFAFTLSLGELNAILMIADDTVQTLPLEIYSALGGYRFARASAIGVVLLLASLLLLLLLNLGTQGRGDRTFRKRS